MYEKVLPLTYVDTLLERVRVAFTDAYGAQLRDKSQLHDFDFLQTYRGISTELEQAALQVRERRAACRAVPALLAQRQLSPARPCRHPRRVCSAPTPRCKRASQLE